jgi:hypothetical protein
LEGEGFAEHEIDEGVQSPGDVVFDDDFAVVARQSRGQALLLGQARSAGVVG